MYKLYDNFFKKVNALHKSKNYHFVDDLFYLLDEQHKVLDEAFDMKALHPYHIGAVNILESLEYARDSLQGIKVHKVGGNKDRSLDKKGIFVMGFGPYNFNIIILNSEFQKTLDHINVLIPKALVMAVNFDNMKRYLDQHISLEVLPNDLFDGERVYLGRGKLIMPTTVRSSGYHVFDISTEKCSCCNDSLLELKLLTVDGFDSVEKAIDAYVDPNLVESVAVARNTESYPLLETSIPIVKEEYKAGMG